MTEGPPPKLNPQQVAAVNHGDGPLLVVAGAGTGKTRVIVERVARLVQSGIPAKRILVVTFTNVAARELKQRINTRTDKDSNALAAGTFHWIGQRLLRRYGSRLPYGSGFRVLSPMQSLAVIRNITKTYQSEASGISPTDLRDAIGDYRVTGKLPLWPHANVVELGAEYVRQVRAEGALDLDDLILESVALLKSHPDVRDSLRRFFLYIMVDEFQDTNWPQIELIRLLTGPRGNLVAVGDDDQAIYGWRHAHVANMSQFVDWFPSARTIRLEQNYRSTPRILRAANALAHHNSHRMRKELFSTQDAGPMPVVFGAGDESEESMFIVDRIGSLLDAQVAVDGIAILYRVNAVSRMIESSLARTGIPYVIRAGSRFYDRPEVARILAGLRVIADPTIESSWVMLLTHISGIGPVKSVRFAKQAMESAQVEPIAGDRSRQPPLPDNVAVIGREIGQFLLRQGNGTGPTPISNAIQFVAAVMKSCGPIGATLIEREAAEANVAELIAAGTEFERERPLSDSPITDFLDQAALVEPTSESQGVQLMTLHAAKGLEFDAVFIVGLEEGLLPHSRSLRSIEQLEEERRLLYVGITRARTYLYLTYARARSMSGLYQPAESSRFLDEIPSPMVEVALGAAETPRHRLLSVAVGERVIHPRWGTGQVSLVEGNGRSTMVSISFDSGATRRVQLCHAPLRRAL